MNTMRLYSGPLSMFGMKVQIALAEKALDFELVLVPFTDQHRYDPKHPDVLRANPKGQVPVLLHGEVAVFDSTQIFEYLEDLAPAPPLWPADIVARAAARQLEHMSDEVYFPHVIRLMGLPADDAAVAARAAAAQFYGRMDALLDGRDYLAGDYSYADIAFYMAQLFGDRMGAPVTAATPRLTAWRDRLTERPPVRGVVGAMASYLVAHGRPLPAFMARTLP